MLNIEEQAIQTYNDNLMFLQREDSKVFEKIILLEEAINSTQYKERYALEYINESFTILELKTNELLYEFGSIKHAKDSLKFVDFSKNKSVFEAYKHFDIPENFEEDLKSLDTKENFLLPTAKLINYANKFSNPKTTHFKKIYKFIFAGTGLGLHILEIHKKIRANSYYIIEDDLEIFRLSLFVTDYAKLSKDGANLTFCIFGDKDEFNQKTQMFLVDSFIYNQYIKFFSFSQTNELKLRELHKIVVSQKHLNFDFVSMMKSILRPIEYLTNMYPLINLNALKKEKLFTDIPVLLLGAGPSLGKNMQWVKENQNKFVIVAISTILYELEYQGIKPDIITHIHGDSLSMPHIQKVKNISFFDDSLCIFSAMAFPKFTNYFKKENIFIFEGNSSYKEGFGSIVTENVGSTSLSLFLKLNVKNLYLLGLDFAFNQETGETHISSHEHLKSATLKEKEDVDGEFDYEMGVIKVKGNFKQEVYSTLLYNDQVGDIERVLSHYLLSIKNNVYNLSDGAFIEHTKALNIKELTLSKLSFLDKVGFNLTLKNALIKDSANSLTKNEIEIIKLNIEDARFRINILEEFYKQKTSNLDTYHHLLLTIIKKTLTNQIDNAGDNLSNILTLYFQFASGYIFDIINTKEIKNPKKLMKDLNKLFVPQLIKIIQDYKKALQNYVDFQQQKG